MHTRQLKVVRIGLPRVGYYKFVPWINLSGVWLKNAGFEIGDNITVSTGTGFLMIWKEKPQTDAL
ncbi:hypothetical protein HNQ91_002952 [Filimonas zeae]|nr:hypothetical protein [Filimonas zeae]